MRALLVTFLLTLTCCGAPRRGIPIVGPTALSKTAERGRMVFLHQCYQCHPGGEGAVGPAINNKPIPRPVIKLQVRTGVLGSMPAFGDDEISDEALDWLLDYMQELRRHRA
jgi:mono/diheme cytochrome c family protein